MTPTTSLDDEQAQLCADSKTFHWRWSITSAGVAM